MVHWTKQTMPSQGEPKPYDQAVADFNVEAFADQMKQTGAGFVVVTTSHTFQYFPAPLESLDSILPGRTSRRDLVADLAAARGKRGIKLMLYYHLGASDDSEWLKACGFWETDTSRFFNNWQACCRDSSNTATSRSSIWRSIRKARSRRKVSDFSNKLRQSCWQNESLFFHLCSYRGQGSFTARTHSSAINW